MSGPSEVRVEAHQTNEPAASDAVREVAGTGVPDHRTAKGAAAWP